MKKILAENFNLFMNFEYGFHPFDAMNVVQVDDQDRRIVANERHLVGRTEWTFAGLHITVGEPFWGSDALQTIL
jgi:hypothetical protein